MRFLESVGIWLDPSLPQFLDFLPSDLEFLHVGVDFNEIFGMLHSFAAVLQHLNQAFCPYNSLSNKEIRPIPKSSTESGSVSFSRRLCLRVNALPTSIPSEIGQDPVFQRVQDLNAEFESKPESAEGVDPASGRHKSRTCGIYEDSHRDMDKSEIDEYIGYRRIYTKSWRR